jgi:aspartate carbamoyltransferase catalytic subunit
MKHLRSVGELDRASALELLALADSMAEINARPIPKVPALRGKTVCSLFFEDSTRTRMSFETAAKRLSADTMNFSVSTSSVNKGESLRDTIETVTAMGVDAFVVRHRTTGVPWQLSRWTNASIVNAGDGWHQHPTQALLDAFTIRRRFGLTGDLAGIRIAVVGDIKHSRVARSDVELFTMLGAEVVLVAPTSLLPPSLEGWGVSSVVHSIDAVIGEIDVLYLLRMQMERQEQSLVPSLAEYTDRFGLTPPRAERLRDSAIVMHPGPMNRGVEIVVDPAELPGSAILDQVANGVSVRMAVLFQLLGSGSGLSESAGGSW